MSRTTPPAPSPRSGSPGSDGGSPRTPRGGRLRDRVSFFERVWSTGRSPSADEDPLDGSAAGTAFFRSPTHHARGARRPSSRTSDSSFEESYERLVEEGELNGAKVVKFEKITVRKSVREYEGSARQLATSTSRSPPSEEHALEDSAYQSHSHGVHSKSSSVTSFARFPSEESLPSSPRRRRDDSPRRQPGQQPEDRPASEWYAEYRSQSFQNVAARMEHVRSRSEYDAHIAEIKGIGCRRGSFSRCGRTSRPDPPRRPSTSAWSYSRPAGRRIYVFIYMYIYVYIALHQPLDNPSAIIRTFLGYSTGKFSDTIRRCNSHDDGVGGRERAFPHVRR